jgi:hypothetical protein
MAPEERAKTRIAPRRGWLLFLLIAVAAVTWLGASDRLSERLAADAAGRGLVLEGGTSERGLFSLVRQEVKLSLATVAGVRATIDRIELVKLPFAAPRMNLGHVRVELRGEPAVLLHALLAALRGDDPAPARLDIDYQHPRLGTIRFQEVKVESRGTWFVLRARKAEAAGRSLGEVVLSVERRKDMLLVAAGDSPAESRLQLSCFPQQQGASRWLLSILHQPLRPLANGIGWNLGDDFEPTQIAGALTLDLPEAESASINGRVSLVFDRWPMAAPPEAEPLLGATLSFLSNIVFSLDLSHGQLPRLEIKTPVFSLVGTGRAGFSPTLSIEAAGQRTCREIKAFLPPSNAREKVERFLGERANAPEDAGARLGLRLEAGGQRVQGAIWSFTPGCGLSAWTPTQP